MTDRTFWVVWDRDNLEAIKGDSDAIRRHPTEAAAIEAAECCAQLMPGREFLVMRVELDVTPVSKSVMRAETIRL